VNIAEQTRLREILHYDPMTGIFTWKMSPSHNVKVGAVAGTKEKKGYINISIEDRKQKAHRLAWLYIYGVWLTEQLDHKNGLKDDNRIDNLRVATGSQNQANGSSTAISGYKGAYFDKRSGKWHAKIKIKGEDTYLGAYPTPQEAHEIYWAKAQQAFGAFARKS
jgi:hypothetical protein